MEQFLALTVALGAVGAVGVAVYTTQQDAPALEAIEDTADDEEPESLGEVEPPTPSASTRPEPTIPEAPKPYVEPPLGPVDDLAIDGANYVPGPDVESASWANS